MMMTFLFIRANIIQGNTVSVPLRTVGIVIVRIILYLAETLLDGRQL